MTAEKASWWNAAGPRDRLAITRANPRASESQAARLLLQRHMASSGWRRCGGTWRHDRSGARVSVATSRGGLGTIVHHDNGRLVSMRINGLDRARRVLAQLARAPQTSDLARDRGGLHAALGIPHGNRIPTDRLRQLARSRHPMAARARLVMSLRARRDPWQ